MPAYQLSLEDEQAQPAVVNAEILAAMQANKRDRDIPGVIRNDANGLQYVTDANLESLVAEGKLMKIQGNDATTYVLDEIGEDNDGHIYNAVFSVPRGGRRRGKKTRKPKRKSRLTRRR
jgi:hypothetical protein